MAPFETKETPSDRLRETTIQLQELHRMIELKDVDPRVLQEFRETLDHVRLAVWELFKRR